MVLLLLYLQDPHNTVLVIPRWTKAIWWLLFSYFLSYLERLKVPWSLVDWYVEQ
jgi:hypothetical protein